MELTDREKQVLQTIYQFAIDINQDYGRAVDVQELPKDNVLARYNGLRVEVGCYSFTGTFNEVWAYLRGIRDILSTEQVRKNKERVG
jgi:hypothetical protein